MKKKYCEKNGFNVIFDKDYNKIINIINEITDKGTI